MSISTGFLPTCTLSEVSGKGVSGRTVNWQPSDSLALSVYVDGENLGNVQWNKQVNQSQFAEMQFSLIFHCDLSDGRHHRVELKINGDQQVAIQHGFEINNQIDVPFYVTPRYVGTIDGVRNGAIEGWLLQNSSDNPTLQGGGAIRFTCDGVLIGYTRASLERSDVAQSMSAPSSCGFRFVPPQAYLKPYSQSFRAFAVASGKELANSPISTSFINDKMQERILELKEIAQDLYRQIGDLRSKLSDLVPQRRYTVSDYNDWYHIYEKSLVKKLSKLRKLRSQPLVSIICPVYKPDISAFCEAVNSVIHQTYVNWELLLVDDCSNDQSLTDEIENFLSVDGRIRREFHEENKGISHTTNTAIGMAKGEWLVFFDHDDLLSPVAIELMVRAALTSGAELVYSNEDKISSSGELSVPAFKPDWNYRLLLGVNYICHLLMVSTVRVREVSNLNPEMDGSQDHDLLLRLSECIPAKKIHHLDEVVYHWRQSPGSTSVAINNKSYAIEAGLKAISNHLRRRGLEADVRHMQGITLYDVAWKFSDTPKVTILIPFRDEIASTIECLRRIEGTNYNNYDIILIDNWSTSPDLPDLVNYLAGHAHIRVIKVEEEFNYSRINNLAALTTDAEFLVFVNNDLYVTSSEWLRSSINEMLADQQISVVGGLFYYPNNTVQHGGVVLGLGGVAGHVHNGVNEGEFGYAGKMMFAQEMSAVTAAGMVVRAAAFRAVGGFDEVGLRVAFNDIDLCLKMRSTGWKIVWNPKFTALHYESLSRGDDMRPIQEERFFQEISMMKSRWGDQITNDPFYSKHFDLSGQAYYDLVDPDE